MAQPANSEKEAQQKETQTSRLKKTFSAIEEMEQKFQSLKNLYVQNLQSLADKIKDTPSDNQHDEKEENMTSTARTEQDCQEFFDDEETLKIKIKKLAELIKKSKHFVAFTGAGISTAAGIADFRSGINTSLDTGAGKWAKNDAIKKGKQYKVGTKKTNSFKAMPTASHMALVGLMKKGYLKYLISQNTDGLHRRSGIPIDQLSELHGNRTLEVCIKCNKGYMRDYKCRNSMRKQTVHDHLTGRICTVPKCGGQLKDTIINFGEVPHEMATEFGFEHSRKADLYLSLGSSLSVSPSCDMPEIVGVKWNHEVNHQMDKEAEHHLVIINIQKTDLDYLCGLRIFAKIDHVMIGLMNELNLNIPKWYLQRYVKIKVDDLQNRGDLRKLTVSGVDIDGTDFSIFTNVKLRDNGFDIRRVGMQRRMSIENLFSKINTNKNCKNKIDEFIFNIPTISIIGVKNDNDNDENKKNAMYDEGLVLELSFYGNYNEPNLEIELNEYLNHLSEKNGNIVLKMIFDPIENEWNVGNKREQLNDENVKKLWSNFHEKQKDEPLPNPYQLRNDD